MQARREQKKIYLLPVRKLLTNVQIPVANSKGEIEPYA
jgi:hypothetical protein